MRLDITLRPLENTFRIPINYNYPLGATFYKLLSNGSKEFTDWLHQRGYISQDGKPMKLFCFSRLFISNPVMHKSLIGGRGDCRVIFSSPVDDQIIDILVKGILLHAFVDIANNMVKAKFRITNVQKIPTPEFSETQKYIMISPTTASTMRETLSGLQTYYLRADDSELSNNLADNLCRKYQIVHKKECAKDFAIMLDSEYITKRGGASRITKLISIKEGHRDEIKVKAFVCPVTIFGPKEIHQIVWDCGLGHKNSLGFGMVDLA